MLLEPEPASNLMFNIDRLLKNVTKCNNFILMLFISTNFQSLKIIEINSSNPLKTVVLLPKICLQHSRVVAGAGAVSKLLH
jgi:hypothetical protein